MWRLLLGAGDALEPLDGARNMALDSALLESVQAGAPPVLRFYLWRPACLSLGRNQPARDLYDPARARVAGVDIVRRPTGGLAVLHDVELTYCVAASVAHIGRPRVAYRRINEWLVTALRALGVDAGLAAAAAAPVRWAAGGAADPCFAMPAAGELVAAGRKLAGSAQRTENGCILQHGSILLDGDQARVRQLERSAHDAVPGLRAAGGSVAIRELTGRVVEPSALAAAAASAAVGDGIRLAPARLDPEERRRWAALASHYASDAWTWRR